MLAVNNNLLNLNIGETTGFMINDGKESGVIDENSKILNLQNLIITTGDNYTTIINGIKFGGEQIKVPLLRLSSYWHWNSHFYYHTITDLKIILLFLGMLMEIHLEFIYKVVK